VVGEEKKIPKKKKPTWAEERNKKKVNSSPPWLAQGQPKREKLHPSENFHSVHTCHPHIGQWVSQNFIPKSESCTDA
jgi:hypothetical protein